MMIQMKSITAQHFELSNTAKGLDASNFIYDEDSQVIGITPKTSENEFAIIQKILDYIWFKYDSNKDD
jgi:hypothetical protein